MTGPVARSSGLCAGATAMLVACAAAAVRLTGTADETRQALRLSFVGVERTPGDTLQIALQNGRIAAATLLCALAAPRLTIGCRAVVDVMLAAVLAVNALLVALALGAYGERLLVAVAPHLPIEFAALSIAGGAYLTARRRPLSLRALAGVAGLVMGLLVVAAVAETYVSGSSA